MLKREGSTGLSVCHRDGCERPSFLVIRFALDGGPEFTAFCKGHLRIAVEFLADFADVIDECPKRTRR